MAAAERRAEEERSAHNAAKLVYLLFLSLPSLSFLQFILSQYLRIYLVFPLSFFSFFYTIVCEGYTNFSMEEIFLHAA